MTWFKMLPKVGESRSMGRDEWKENYRMCRVMTKLVDSTIDYEAMDKMIIDTLIYGHGSYETQLDGAA